MRFLSSVMAVGLVLWGAFVCADPNDWAERGNGGDVIVCPQSPLGNLMYDAYEAEVRYQFKLIFPDLEEPEWPDTGAPNYGDEMSLDFSLKIAKELVQRIETQDPVRAQRYFQWLAEFKNDTRFLPEVELFDIPDTGIGFIPPQCSLHQLIIQRTPKFPQDRRYMVALDYWQWMQPEQQAAAILHEIIYRDLAESKAWTGTSEPARYFNALILSDAIGQMSHVEYLNITRRIFNGN
ncbi:hypothetical protein [Bdellovibrio sp. BCCA]|uniref:hypothetical protein n=1 Tax=Bdellovibrio sp. BCCA TaxID=3136281 RepID=UPI0030EFB4AE